MEKVVHCKTEEEFYIVLSWLSQDNLKITFSSNPKDKQYGNCISYNKNKKFTGFSQLEYYLGDNLEEYEIIQFEEWCELNQITNKYKNTEKSMEKIMLDVLNKTYDNPLLRRRTVPLFMADPGIGKTTIIKRFAEEKGIKMTKITLSQRMPNEVVGMVMPDVATGKLVIYDSYELTSLEDGDILFFDEVFNGTLKQTLDAVLNLLEDRMLPSGKKLADVMIVAASNPQGLINLTPQIKERFIRYDLKFDKDEYQEYLFNQYGIPQTISKHLSTLITKEKFDNNQWNFHTARSIEKAINQIGCDLISPYNDILIPYLSQKIKLENDYNDLNYKKGEDIEFIKVLKLIIKKQNEVISKKPKVNDTKNSKQKSRTSNNILN